MNNIIFTRDIRADLQLKLADFGIADIFVLVDNNSRNFCQRSFEDFGIPEEHIITIPEGEHHKSLVRFGRYCPIRGPGEMLFW